MHLGIDTVKVKSAIPEEDDVGRRGRCPVVIGVHEKRFDCRGMHAAIAEGIVNLIGADDFSAVPAACRLGAPICESLRSLLEHSVRDDDVIGTLCRGQ